MIDETSRVFMDWVKERHKDPKTYRSDLSLAHIFYQGFFELPQEEISSRLMKKLEKGAEEHGAPIYTPIQVKKELEDEYIDCLGWLLVKIWNDAKT